MSPSEFVLILIVVGYAIYRQSRRHVVSGSGRFHLAATYIIIGLVLGGLNSPNKVSEVVLLDVSLLLSLVVGVMRGRLSRLWVENGQVYSQGTPVTIGLFVALVVVKLAIGTGAYFLHISDSSNFGEILLMIGVMVAFQAELMWRRARRLSPSA